MNKLFTLIIFLVITHAGFSQSCTISCGPTPCTVQWVNTPTPTCANGGTITIPFGVTLEFNNVSDTWTGSSIIVEGTLLISANGPQINSSIIIKDDGILSVTGKLQIGTDDNNPSTSCPYTVLIEPGGIVNVSDGGGGADDRLSICDNVVIISDTPGSGQCNEYDPDADPPTELPYCNPLGGFQCGGTGQPTCPLSFSESGVTPIVLAYFNLSIPKNENRTLIEWATSSEENFSHFEIQRAGKDLRFTTIFQLPGAGYNTNSLKEYAAYDENPLIGIGYYRLKAVDIDGSYEYFKVKSVNHGGGRRLLVSPNPTTGNSFSYSINWDPGLYDRISLIDAIGNEVYSAPVTSLQNELHMNKTLRPGAYLLRYTGPSFQEVARVFIKD